MAGNPPDKPGKGNRSGKRSAKALAKERLEVVDQMLHKCYTHSAVCGILAKQWDITPRQVRNYIRKVYEMWAEDAKKTLVDRVSLRRTQLEQVLEDAMLRRVKVKDKKAQGGFRMEPDPDLRVAVAALDRLCKVDGAYAPIEVATTVVGQIDLKKMTSDDKRKALAKLMTKANSRAQSAKPN